MSAAFSMRRARPAKGVLRSAWKVVTASWSFCSIWASERGWNVLSTSPVAGFVVAMAIRSYLSSRVDRSYHDNSLMITCTHWEPPPLVYTYGIYVEDVDGHRQGVSLGQQPGGSLAKGVPLQNQGSRDLSSRTGGCFARER